MKYVIRGIVIIMLIALAVAFSRPVLFSFSTGSMSGDSDYVILNPFRDQGPEKCAETFFQILKEDDSANCRKELSFIVDTNKLISACDKEKKYPLASWHLTERKDSGRSSEMIYRHTATGIDGSPRLFIKVLRSVNSWNVIEYER